MKNEEILKKLRDAKGFVSGQELCTYYGVSRTAIWKVIRQLEKDGYVIEAQNNKGYRLVENENADLFSKVEIESKIETNWVGRNIIFHKETSSTNIDAKELAEKGEAAGTVVVADMQTAGRGRRGRGWVSPAGKDIYMTVVLRPQCRPEKASVLTLVMALAVLKAVSEQIPQKCSIKWPNDIVVNGKKICGILTEMSAELDGIHYVVIGTGINVNQEFLAEEIQETATALRIECGHQINRATLVARTLYYLEKYYAIFEENWDFSGLVNEYNQFLVNRDREVCVLDPKGAYEGTARGINENGELLVERKSDGELVQVYAGEVSVRGIYGYV
ncbi:MAG: biotin--[acetyl-CoA-carboxylase] ligase [Lachnospiraceae bacterium]|jgi:BirA family biotin operon repressor/biotin-[acetyl-CoA-carboxylase] ligase|nr:biotin--[acetyl-CoA-carboxylase] ligase [Lachnospiraceae bacterium]HBV83893.1 biotin--[acetyl-CoA-carboxylase] ligase [Lachnospiraceae bacterium]